MTYVQYEQMMKERFGKLTATIDNVMQGANGNDAQKRELAQRLFESSNIYWESLAENARPEWLTRIRCEASGTKDDYHRFPTLLKTIAQYFHLVTHVIREQDDESLASFDDVFSRLRKAYKVPDLFDRMILQLEQMVRSKELDGAAVIDAINRMIRILKANRDGSFAAVHGSFKLAVFLGKVLKKYSQKIPMIGPLFEAFHETVNDAQDAIDQVERAMFRETIAFAIAERERLEHSLDATLKALMDEVDRPRIESDNTIAIDAHDTPTL